MSKRTITLFLAAIALVFFMSFQKAEAATVGTWSKTCTAPNWMTGVPEAVPDQNVNNPSAGFWGFTSKQPGGHWLTQYNLARINAGPDVMIFLFYHECAHAQFNTTSEAVADCEGLKAMNADVGVSQQVFADITQAYASVGRPFPSGGPCH